MDIRPFQIIKSLGRGATSEVFEVVNPETSKHSALKTLYGQYNPESLSRLKLEGEILRDLRHPNVVQLFSFFETKDAFGLELELVTGMTLSLWNSQNPNGLLEPKIWILAQIARGLGVAHEKSIIHRDLKPENILMSNSGEVKISDFGLARLREGQNLTQSGGIVGTLGYLPPEVFAGEPFSHKADIFSLGAIAYELFGGVGPFHGPNSQTIVRNIIEGKFKPLSDMNPRVPKRLAAVIESSLHRDPTKRPESIWAIESEIMGVLMESGLLTYCQRLCSDNPGFVLEAAMRIKFEGLSKKWNGLKKSSELTVAERRREILALLPEFQALFPNAKEIGEMLEGMKMSTPKKTKRKILALFLIIGTLGAGIYFLMKNLIDSRFLSRTEVVVKPIPAVPVTIPPIVAPPIQKVEVAKPKPPHKKTELPSKKQSHGKPVEIAKPMVAVVPVEVAKPLPSANASSGTPHQKLGWVKFDVPSDVKIYMDGKELAGPDRKILETREGHYHLVLKRDGYPPIDGDIEVQSGKTRVVRVGEDQ